MEKTITTAILVIASIIMTVALINAVIPAAARGSGALITANTSATDRIKTDIDIVFASGNSTGDEINFWVKNIGSKTIRTINDSDIFLTTPTTISRVPYDASCSASVPPCWSHVLEGSAADWNQSETIKVTAHLSSGSTGLHKVSIAVYNAVSAEKEFSI